METLTVKDVQEATAGNIEASLQPEGIYTVQMISDTVKVRMSKNSGLPYLTAVFGTLENEAGEKAYSAPIYKIVAFAGTNKSGKPNHHQFSQAFGALGFDAEEVVALFSSLNASIQDAGEIPSEGLDVSLTINGEPVTLKGKRASAKVTQSEYNGKTKNEITSLRRIA